MSGFTLIELTVVTAIIVVITGVVLVNNNRFGGMVILQNFAYDVALSIRQAQVYGISVRQYSANFSAGYGVHFDLSSPETYALFADVYPAVANGGGDGLFEANQSELVEAANISRGYSIKQLCATPAGGSEVCDGITTLDVVFRRPEPDAWISANNTSCTANTANCQESARIVVASPRGDTLNVIIKANGQISVHS